MYMLFSYFIFGVIMLSGLALASLLVGSEAWDDEDD